MNALKLTLLRLFSQSAWGAAFVGGGDFEAVGKEFIGHFQRFGLRPSHDVLDLGCGVGRMALPLAEYLTGSYVGIDVSAKAIEMCRDRISRSDFRFIHADIHNPIYSSHGKNKASDYRLPLNDRSFDFVFLTSVFTHLLRDEVERYLSEISRVMRPSATCFITWFILDDVSAPGGFRQGPDGCFIKNPRKPTAAVAYAESYVKDVYRRNGLTADVYPGIWGRQEGLSYQDIVVSHRRPMPAVKV